MQRRVTAASGGRLLRSTTKNRGGTLRHRDAHAYEEGRLVAEYRPADEIAGGKIQRRGECRCTWPLVTRTRGDTERDVAATLGTTVRCSRNRTLWDRNLGTAAVADRILEMTMVAWADTQHGTGRDRNTGDEQKDRQQTRDGYADRSAHLGSFLTVAQLTILVKAGLDPVL